MTKSLKILGAALLISAVPAALHAQWLDTMVFESYTDRYRGQYIAPYALRLPAPDGPVFDVFCIDPTVEPHGDPYLGWASPITPETLQNTKVYASEGGPSAFERYWKTAWLAEQFDPDGTWTNKQRASVQGALWEFGGMLEDGGSVWTDAGAGAPDWIDDWVAAANAAYASDPGQIDAASWLVLTGADPQTPQQEFLVYMPDAPLLLQDPVSSQLRTPVSSPEPATWLLLVTGLLIVLGVRVRVDRARAVDRACAD